MTITEIVDHPLVMGGITQEQTNLIQIFGLSLTSLSIIMSFTAIVVFLQILHYRPDLADRVSFRLSVATNISDLFFSLFHLTIILYKTPGPLCSIVGWGWAFFSLTSVFYTVCIAINLQLIFIYEYKGRHNLEKYYFLCPILLALFFSLLPLTQNMWGYSVTEGICWYRNSDDISTILWQWFTLFAWITLSVIYCFLVVIAVVLKLRHTTIDFTEILNSLPLASSAKRELMLTFKQRKLISTIVRKVIWYPIVPLISQMSNYIVKTHIYATKTICFELYLLAYITCSLQGTLNALVFSQDIAVSRASQSLRRYWWKIYVNPFENRYPNLSRNKSFPSQKGTSTDDQYCALNYSSAIEIDSADDIAIKLDVITSHINSFSTANYHPDTSKVFPYPPYWERFRYLLLVSLLNRPSVQDEVALEQVESRSRLSLYSTNVERRQCHVSSTKLASLSTLNQVNSSELSESNSISSEDRLKTILAKVNAAKLARSHSVLIPDNLNWESNNGNVSKLDSNILAIPDPVIENSNSAHLAIVELVNLPSINQAESLILESATPTLENNNDNNNHDIIPGFEQSLNVSFHSNLSDNEYQDTLRKL